MTWEVLFMDQAKADLAALDNSQRMQVIKAIIKVAQNPLPDSEGGYGKPLSNLSSSRLVGCYKIKLLKLGLRVVYKIIRDENVMKIIVIGARGDSEVYQEAERRIQKKLDP